MGVIAKGEITLSTVNDAYTVSLSKPSCIIHADFDGSNPQLNDANTIITVKRGDKEMSFQCAVIQSDCTCTCGTPNQKQWYLSIDELPQSAMDALRGSVVMRIVTEDGYTTDVTFTFTIVRETSMLDWILDWEGGKTKVGSTYIMTPKIFIGKKSTNVIDNGDGTLTMNTQALTGVYIGPDDRSTGIYGYKDGNEIFHINEQGGMIGGWTINNGGIQSSNGRLSLLSGGAIRALDGFGNTAWEILSSGNAYFCGDKVKFFGNGNAFFEGHITSASGSIGGWEITQDYLYNNNLFIDSTLGFGVLCDPSDFAGQTEPHTTMVEEVVDKGGVAMYYDSANSFGLIGYIAGGGDGNRVFSIGSNNFIAGWNFNNLSLYRGTVNNTTGGFTSKSGDITIGSNGMRGYKWCIDSNGHASFANNVVNFNADGTGSISGWGITTDRLNTSYASLVANVNLSGLFLSSSIISNIATASLINTIQTNGGIALYRDVSSSVLMSYTASGDMVFKLSNTENKIAGWKFDKVAMWNGTQKNVSGSFTTSTNDITIGSTGIRGFKWRLEATGAGAIAYGNIAWDADGNITFDGTKMKWAGTESTMIDEHGIFTGNINANNITTGTLSAVDIKQTANAWWLKQDGSGRLANGGISWDINGNMNINKAIIKNVKVTGSVYQPWTRSGLFFSLGDNDEDLVTFDNIAAGESGGWGDGSIQSNITWLNRDSGRIIRIANWKFQGQTFDGHIDIKAPAGKYFFEDGIAKTKLVLSREIVELIGYGDGNTFYGWIVIDRQDLMTTRRYGRPLKILAQGRGGSSNASDTYLKCITFDGTTMTIVRNGTGQYTISIPSEWGLQSGEYIVLAVGYGGNGVVKPVVKSLDAESFSVYTSDDESRNDGQFMFIITNFNDWSLLNA